MEEKKTGALPGNVNTNLSIIDNINVQLVQQTMQKIASFQAVVKNTLKEGHDYGTIPGTGSKPTLLKPGAEKILMLLGLTSEYELIEKVLDYEKGFFAFTVKCVIYRNGQKITEGMGHANTREKRYTSGKQHDPYTLANTVLKMAKKRAQVDAVLTVASLSEIFTQDLEDEEDDTDIPQPKKKYEQTISEAQRRRLFAIAGDERIVREVLTKHGFSSTSEIPRGKYDEICAEVEAMKKQQENATETIDFEAAQAQQ